jgi:hemoglobin
MTSGAVLRRTTVDAGVSEVQPSHFELLGGETGIRRLVDAFYDRMDAAEEAAGIRALHPPDLTTSREKLFLFLVGWMGGPPLYVQTYGHPMLRARHLPFPIGIAERDAWVWCMDHALAEHDMPEELREYLRLRFRSVADHMRNQAEIVS